MAKCDILIETTTATKNATACSLLLCAPSNSQMLDVKSLTNKEKVCFSQQAPQVQPPSLCQFKWVNIERFIRSRILERHSQPVMKASSATVSSEIFHPPNVLFTILSIIIHLCCPQFNLSLYHLRLLVQNTEINTEKNK